MAGDELLVEMNLVSGSCRRSGKGSRSCFIRNRSVRHVILSLARGDWRDVHELVAVGGFMTTDNLLRNLMLHDFMLERIGVEVVQKDMATGKGQLRLRLISK